MKSTQATNLFVTTTQINQITVNGDVKIRFYSELTDSLYVDLVTDNTEAIIQMNANNVKLITTGKGFATLNGNFNNLEVNVLKDATLTLNTVAKSVSYIGKDYSYGYLSGTAESFNVIVTDESYISAYNLPSKNCNISIKNYAEALINTSEVLNVIINNNGNLKYKGSPNINLVDVSGSVYIKNKK
jgi:hypothetical protein